MNGKTPAEAEAADEPNQQDSPGNEGVKGHDGPEGGGPKKKIDVSVAQVAGSTLAAVIAALIAGRLGVYGTFIGAGVVSVVATTGGPVFQHLFRRTGEQVKDVTVAAAPRARRTARLPRGATPAGANAGANAIGDTNADGSADGAADRDVRSEGYGAAVTHGTRSRRWKRSLLPAALVFAVAIGGLTTYELLSGTNVSGGRGGTTSFGEAFQRTSPDVTPDPGTGTGPEAESGSGGGTGSSDQPWQGPSPDAAPDTGAPDAPATGGTGGTGADGGTGGQVAPTPDPAPTPEATDGTTGDPGATTGGSSSGSGTSSGSGSAGTSGDAGEAAGTGGEQQDGGGDAGAG
ncbi:hypothetical protein QNO07_21365 [Streptomyces sp. 549]|uniref:hypothetical protein n=1 Tax=Streptomyces sp. 549 TaxID=3049076 RepID=UPI0024C2B8A6|nr:hypothetical protein [Streptomyces sp. 549]MDK1475933.1 hypothetical protein [Streptomyces sp. 549]